MLGVALNAQRAGWGEQPFTVDIPCVTAVNQIIYQTPSYSFLMNNSDRNWEIDAGDYDLTGYSSISGFNNRRYSVVMNMYFPWPSGLSDGYYGGPINFLFKKTSESNISFNITLGIYGGALEFSSGYDLGTPIVDLSPYTNYTNRWLTVVSCGAETSSVFTDWNPVGPYTGDNYNRLCVFDTETGELLGKQDQADSQLRGNISGYGNSVSSLSSDANSVSVTGFSGGGQEIRQAGVWYSFGTMFDPLTLTSDVWRTTRPGATIGNATAWMNATATTYYNSGANYWMDEDTDIFTPDTADQILNLTGGGNAAFTTGYSTTIIPKDES